jgi:hypothetical protein
MAEWLNACGEAAVVFSFSCLHVLSLGSWVLNPVNYFSTSQTID